MPRQIEFLTVEIGSTITKVNGFQLGKDGSFELLAQGFAPTSISLGDIRIGYEEALAVLKKQGTAIAVNTRIYVNSSAAGGLRMTVHGLTYSMTARAAREAALGAGAIVKMVTAGLLDDFALAEIRNINPNIILLAGWSRFWRKRCCHKKRALIGFS